MLSQYFQTLQNCLKVGELRSRIFFTLAILVVCQVVAMTPIPGLDGQELLAFFDSLREQQNTGSGGAHERKRRAHAHPPKKNTNRKVLFQDAGGDPSGVALATRR